MSTQTEFNSAISALSRPPAEPIRSALREFEQTSSAKFSLLWAGVNDLGFISYKFTFIPRLAKKYAASDIATAFRNDLPHKYYDENLVHGYMLGFIGGDLEAKKREISKLLPFMDNWAVVDSTVSNLKKFFKKPEDVCDFVLETLSSDAEYTVRFGIVSLLNYYLDGTCAKMAIEQVKNIHSDKFYVKMAQAWFFATALTKNYELALPIIEGNILDKWTHNKAIQKARESLCIPKDKKDYLKTFRR